MDDTKLIFEKIRHRDNDSFHILTENYGWKLYSHIRRNVETRELADQIFSETLAKFQEDAEKSDCSDPIEAMLFHYADTLNAEHMRAPAVNGPGGMNPCSCAVSMETQKKKEKHPVGAAILYTICIILLLAAIAAALWFLIGMLVDMNILPQEWDFGYSWFNQNIADIF